MPMILRTHIAIDECRARLASAVDPVRWGFSLSGYAGAKPILGKLRDTTFRLQMRPCYRNSFAPLFFGHFVASAEGTVVEGDFRMHPFVRVFMIFWFSFLVVFAAIALVVPSRDQPEAPWGRAALLIVAAGMGAFGVGLVKFGGWLGRTEKEVIVGFLKSTLEANETA
jgi:hypothetical protein